MCKSDGYRRFLGTVALLRRLMLRQRDKKTGRVHSMRLSNAVVYLLLISWCGALGTDARGFWVRHHGNENRRFTVDHMIQVNRVNFFSKTRRVWLMIKNVAGSNNYRTLQAVRRFIQPWYSCDGG